MDPQSLNEQKCRDLVAAYRSERMPADRRAAAWARLQAEIGEDDDELPGRAQRGDRRRDLIWGGVLVAAAVVLVVVGTRGRVSQQTDRDSHSQAAHGAAGSTDALTPATNAHGASAGAESDESPQPPVVPEAAPESRPRVPAVRAVDVPKDMPALDAELALLRAAREALARKSPAAALQSLEQHAREFPGGHLVEERMLLRAQAQCELGERAAARAAAAELVRAFPQSPHAATVAELCAD
jgi:TolA-binding protein